MSILCLYWQSRICHYRKNTSQLGFILHQYACHPHGLKIEALVNTRANGTPNAQGVAEEFGGESACWRRMIEQVLAGVAAAALWMLGLLIATRIGGLPERVLLRSSSRCARAGPSSPAGCQTALR